MEKEISTGTLYQMESALKVSKFKQVRINAQFFINKFCFFMGPSLYLSINGHLDCFHVLAVVNDSAINVGVQISLQDSDYISLKNITRVGLLDHVVVLFLIFLRKLHIVFHSGCLNL